jgi:hypothetical protein
MAGTTTSSGLNNILSSSNQVQTTLPSWYDAAQQNIVNQAGTALGGAPSFGNTTAQGAVNTLQGSTNPFTQAQNSLNTIASGAANPWTVTPQYAQPNYGAGQPAFTGSQQGDTFVPGSGNIGDDMTGGGQQYFGSQSDIKAQQLAGGSNGLDAGMGGLMGMGGMQPMASQVQGQPTGYNVAPNPNTAMGGLFQAQNQQLNQLLPNYTAPAQANAIGSGNFGSLRGQTAVDKAKADAFSTLTAQQMQAALQNQQTGAQAAGALGNVGAQGITAGLTTGAAQMNSPFQGATNYSNLINSINAPTTATQQTQLSPLQMVSSLAGLPSTGTNLLNSLFGKAATGVAGQPGYVPGVQGLVPSLSSLFSSNTTPISDATQAARDASGTSGINSGNPLPDIGGGSLPTDTTGGGYVDPNTGESVGP